MRTLLSIIILCCLGLATARADLVIEINQGVRSALPVAVVPFGNQTGQALSEDLAVIIAANLQRTGDITPMRREDMLSLPASGEQVMFRDWRVLGQRYLLVGSVALQAPQSSVYRVSYELFDVQSGDRLIGRELAGTADQLRDMAHSISDLVYEALTGIPGAFSTRIAYVLLEGEGESLRYSLQVADADGRRSRVIFRSQQPIISPAWSPDARKLAYVSFERRRPTIFIQDIASGVRTEMAAHPGINSAPAWSPDGTKLAMTLSKDGNPEIYVLDLKTNALTRMTEHWGIDTEPSWSADGRTLVFTSDRSGGPQVYRMPATGGKPVRVTFEGAYNARPRYSVNGRELYYVHRQPGQRYSLAALELRSAQTRLLTATDMDEAPSVAPNGSMIIYATKRRGESVLAVIGVKTGSRYFLPALNGSVREPAWSPYLSTAPRS